MGAVGASMDCEATVTNKVSGMFLLGCTTFVLYMVSIFNIDELMYILNVFLFRMAVLNLLVDTVRTLCFMLEVVLMY